MNLYAAVMLCLLVAAILFTQRPWLSRTRRVVNTGRRFGEAGTYFAVELLHEGTPTVLLLTEAELEEAIRRGVKQPEDAKPTPWFSLLLALVVATAACRGTVQLADSQGRQFIRVREATEGTAEKPGSAELWQRVGATGPAHPFYLRLLTPKDTPPMFTTAAP